jgi:hypothetical protein
MAEEFLSRLVLPLHEEASIVQGDVPDLVEENLEGVEASGDTAGGTHPDKCPVFRPVRRVAAMGLSRVRALGGLVGKADSEFPAVTT